MISFIGFKLPCESLTVTFNADNDLAASFGGAAIFCIVVLGPQLLSYLQVPWAAQLMLPWWWQTLVVMGLTTVLWVSVALLTPPDPPELLRSFYERARPLGWWQHYKLHSITALRGNAVKPIFRGIMIAILGFAATSMLITGLTQAWFARYWQSVMLLLASALLFFIFRKMANTYLSWLANRAAGNRPGLEKQSFETLSNKA